MNIGKSWERHKFHSLNKQMCHLLKAHSKWAGCNWLQHNLYYRDNHQIRYSFHDPNMLKKNLTLSQSSLSIDIDFQNNDRNSCKYLGQHRSLSGDSGCMLLRCWTIVHNRLDIGTEVLHSRCNNCIVLAQYILLDLNIFQD